MGSRWALGVFWLGLVWVCLASCYQHLPSADLWWLLADGRLVAESGAIPSHDPFSWSAAGANWHNDQWLSGTLGYYLYQWAGLSGLHVAKAALLTATLLLLLDTGRRLQRQWAPLGLMVALGVSLATCEGRFFFDVRAYLFTYLGLALLWRWLQLQQRLDLRKVAVLFACWCNLHGGVSAGLLLLGLEALFSEPERRRHLLRALLVAGMCCCLNPSGAWLLLHPLMLLGSQWGRYLNEWQPCWRKPALFSAQLVHMALWGLAWALWRRRGSESHDKVLWVFALFTLTGWRHIPLFALLSLPRWCRLLDGPTAGWLPGTAWLALLSWAGVTPLQLGDPTQSMESSMFPQQACAFLRSHRLPSRLFHPYGLGGYLLWSFPGGEYRVCIDGRAVQVYPWECYEDYLKAVYNAKQFDNYCQRNHLEVAMLFANPSRSEASCRLVAGNPAWTEIYRDDLVVIVTTRSARYSHR